MSSKSKSTTKVTPYDPAAINAASGALKGAYGTTQGTIAQWSPALNNAIGQINNNITHPPSFVTDAQAQLDKTINGDYLNPESNPYASGMAKLIGDRTQGNYNATFGASGRSHGGLAAMLQGQGVGDALQSFYGNIYEGERGRQQAATMAAPAFHQDQYTDINELFPAVNNTAMLPINAANAYAGGLGQLIAPYATQTTKSKQGFGLQQALGLAGMIGGALMPMPSAIPMGGGGGGLMNMGGGNGSGYVGLGGSFLG
jgi:hypothetical protein